MTEPGREAWITGVGIVSCLGEGPDAHWLALNEGHLRVDTQSHAPYVIHPLAPIDFDKQIPKKGDQRQMEAWQRIGTYAAGLALENAGVKGNAEVLSRMDLIVAAGGGERDEIADSTVLTGLPKAANAAAFLNERLTNDLRPTLFLAQLSNLLAGNISIVHGVTGSSRTFMGEESAGMDAMRIALARINAGQSEIALVGGANNAERKYIMMIYEFAGLNWKGSHEPVWNRNAHGGGFALGSLGAFLVLESRVHAERRGATPFAKLSCVLVDRTKRQAGALTTALALMWQSLKTRLQPGGIAVISGATGAEPATGEERAFLSTLPDVAVRAPASYIGHGMEPQFPMNVALAAVSVKQGRLFATHDISGVEASHTGALRQAVVTGVGHWRGEGMALVETAS
jgi:3-oxoacyl-[acyl-carrier-protein] synthase II